MTTSKEMHKITRLILFVSAIMLMLSCGKSKPDSTPTLISVDKFTIEAADPKSDSWWWSHLKQ